MNKDDPGIVYVQTRILPLFMYIPSTGYWVQTEASGAAHFKVDNQINTVHLS